MAGGFFCICESYLPLQFFNRKDRQVGFWVNTVAIAQLVRASDCGSEGRRFEPG